jgi:hypothetical protein
VALIQQAMLESLKSINTDGHAKATQDVLLACRRLADEVWRPIQDELSGRTSRCFWGGEEIFGYCQVG